MLFSSSACLVSSSVSVFGFSGSGYSGFVVYLRAPFSSGWCNVGWVGYSPLAFSV